jgi:AcrR family transcriptional regulator
MTDQTAPPLDRRIRRTRATLRDALIELILERGFDAITVQDITDRANLARATFYLHYRDKEDLLKRCLEDVYDDLGERIERRDPRLFAEDRTSLAWLVFEHALEHADLYRIILYGHGQGLILPRIRRRLADCVETQLGTLQLRRESPAEPDVVAHHLVGALLGLVAWWLDRGMPYTLEEMAQMFRTLGEPGARAALGLPPLGGLPDR